MEASEAMGVMHAAGRGDEADQIVSEAVRSAQGRYSAIETDESRTEDYKQAELARVYEESREAVRSKLEGLANECRRASNGDAARVFGIEGLGGDVASLAISRRDAVDRVSRVESKGERMKMLQDATRSGDEVLARAVAHQALENSDVETMNAFLADRPALEAATERLWNARPTLTGGPKGGHKFRHTMTLHGLRPAGLR